ncbi:hypothetical protein BH10ACI1_BH10ACI1_09550 [soil metagenome]
MKLDFTVSNDNNGKEFIQVPFKKKGSICPLCGRKTGWFCDVTEDDGLAFCSYTPSEKTDKKGRFQHILKTGHQKPVAVNKEILEEKIMETQKADVEKLNQVYMAFLKGLELKEFHLDNLKGRGLSEERISEKLYASVPSYLQRFEVAEKLAESFDLEGIPGFYFENGRWALNLTFDGFYVPYRDAEGRIIGLQIRQDKNVENKYLWLSSAKKEKGCSSGVPLHFVNTELVETGEIFITEGALKADIIGELYNVGVIAMGGVNVLKADNLVSSLYETFPNLERVVLAFDMDWEIKDEVKDALLKLLKALKQKYLSVFVLTWDRDLGKGFDDILFDFLHREETIGNPLICVKAEEFDAKYLATKTEEIDLTMNEKENKESQNLPNIPLNLEQCESPLDDIDLDFVESADTFGATWNKFSTIKFPVSERVIFGLNRGNIGLLNAPTNVGKSTLILNLALSAASNRTFVPLLNEETVGRKILYIDGEATKSELQSDINKMSEQLTVEEQKLLKNNLCLICDEEIDNEPIDLASPNHLAKVLEMAIDFQPDLIIVDTLSALTIMEDENDNAKVKKEIIQPLKILAKKTDSALLVLHHTGKWSEGSSQSVSVAYKGRGASAFGALARTVFYLEPVKNTSNKVRLSCPKVKGEKFEPVIMELDRDKRWFQIVEIEETQKAKNTYYDEVVEVVRGFYGTEIKKDEITKALVENGCKISAPSLTRKLGEAVANGDLLNPKYGYYSSPVNPDCELPLAE